MKTVGIIAEYNPFHNGHLYQLKKAKEITGADYVVVVMSGDFVQRGYPAFMDKFSRCEMALSAGADLVIELPVRYATASAEYFAKGAVSILNNLGCVDSICFGSECGDIHSMKNIADYIHKDCDDFNNHVVKYVKSGLTYPLARKNSILDHFKEMDPIYLEQILSSPNNILGIEYLKALASLNSTIIPYTVTRVSTGYHEESLKVEEEHPFHINSATAIRKHFLAEISLEGVKSSVPREVYDILESNFRRTYPIEPDDISDYLYYQLLSLSDEEMLRYLDLSSDLICRIRNLQTDYKSFQGFAEELKSKQYTLTRMNRSLLHLVLNIYDMDIKDRNSLEIAPYIRVLGLNKRASCLLKNTKEREFPVITKMANAKNLLSDSAFEMLKEDIFASTLYQRMVYKKYKTTLPNEFKKTPIIK